MSLELTKAIDVMLESAKAKFDESVEAHFNFNLDVKQADQMLRATTSLPHGTGKEVKVAVLSSKEIKEADLNLTESDLPKLEKGKIRPKVDFDVLIVEPSYMAKLAKLGPILGPAGAMPNPRNGTVTEKVAEAVKQFKKGKISLKTEQNDPIMHVIIGKKSFDKKALKENFEEIFMTLKQNKPQKAKPNWIKSAFITSSMGKSVEVDLNVL